MKKYWHYGLFLALVLVLGLTLRSAFIPSDYVGSSPHRSSPVIYTAGCCSDDNNLSIPCYWKGTTRINLPTANEYFNGCATSIHISGGTVYTAGFCADDTLYQETPGCWANMIPCYWTNAIRTELPIASGYRYGIAQSIYVSGRTVYTAGYCYSGTNFIPCYWRNTSRTDLPMAAGFTFGAATSIYVSKGTVYTAGSYADGKYLYPCYWKGKTRTDLPPGRDKRASAESIHVSKGTVYTAGDYVSDNHRIPCYWKGTTLIPLLKTNKAAHGILSSNLASDGHASAIDVSNGKIYIAGHYKFSSHTHPCYWVGKIRTDLPDYYANEGKTSSIFVFKGTVYTAGVYSKILTGNKIPCYWKGRTHTNLPIDPDTTSGKVDSIFVSEL